jgi:hypothetical protein
VWYTPEDNPSAKENVLGIEESVENALGKESAENALGTESAENALGTESAKNALGTESAENALGTEESGENALLGIESAQKALCTLKPSDTESIAKKAPCILSVEKASGRKSGMLPPSSPIMSRSRALLLLLVLLLLLMASLSSSERACSGQEAHWWDIIVLRAHVSPLLYYSL